MTRWREHILCLSLTSQLLRENLALNVRIGSNIADWQSNSLAHDLSIKVVSLDILLDLPRHQFDWVRVRPMCRLVCFPFHVTLVVDQVVIIDDDCRQVLGELVFEVGIVRVASSRLCKRVTSDVNHINGLSQRQVPQTALTVHHVERDIEFLHLYKVIALVEHLRVELEKLVARQIQTL